MPPAIAHIRNQLDNWNGSDNSVPENLQLANLPVLADQYMEDQDDGAGAIVQYVSKGIIIPRLKSLIKAMQLHLPMPLHARM